jgi:NAD(P)-dependent dehydrogenase (short-subunit alcohol dehydrogenase family)
MSGSRVYACEPEPEARSRSAVRQQALGGRVEHFSTASASSSWPARKQSDAEALGGPGSGRTQPVVHDVTDGESITSVMRTVDATSPGSLDRLVDNAGVSVGGPLEFVALDDWRRGLEVAFVGQVAVTHAALPALRKARGRIVNLTSIGGRLASPFLGPYKASKYPLEAVTDALRLERSARAPHRAGLLPEPYLRLHDTPRQKRRDLLTGVTCSSPVSRCA